MVVLYILCGSVRAQKFPPMRKRRITLFDRFIGLRDE
jgi:hypothetical protein